MTKDRKAEFQRLEGVLEETRKVREDALLKMQVILMAIKGLDNIAAGIFKEAGGDVDKALEMVADRISD